MRLKILFLTTIFSHFALAEETPLVPLPEVTPLQEELMVKPPENPPEVLMQLNLPETISPAVVIELPKPAPKNCAADFTKAINELETTARLPLLETMTAVKRIDKSINAYRLISPPEDLKGKDWYEAMRMSRLIAQSNGIDPALYTTAAIGDIIYRSTHELKGYTTQSVTPGICSGAWVLTKFYRDRNAGLYQRKELYEKLQTLTIAEIKKDKTDFAYNIADLSVKEKRAALFSESASDKISTRTTKLMNMLAWLSEGNARVGLLTDKLENVMSGIEMAHAVECGCNKP